MTDNAILLTQGDLTQLGCEALVLPMDRQGLESRFRGRLHRAVTEIPGFRDDYRHAYQAFLAHKNQEWLEIGDTFWVPLRRTEPPYGIVCVAAAGGHSHAQHAALAVAAAIRCAAPKLDSRRTAKKPTLTIALPAVLLGGGGGRWDEHKVAEAQLEAARTALQDFPGVDAVFVLYTPNDYRLFSDARQRIGAAPPLPDTLTAAVPELATAIAADESALFVGAGVSEGAGLPGYKAVIAAMARELGITAVGDDQESALEVAQWYRNHHGAAHSARVQQLLLRLLDRPEILPSLSHYLLLGLPIRHILTTNYDDLLERTLTHLRRFPVSVAQARDIPQTGGRGVYTVKLHGDLAHGDWSGDYDDVVLSRDDYDDFFDRRPLMASLLEGLLLNRTFLFVGYSLRDPNFRLIFNKLDRQLREARRPAYVLTFDEPSEHQRTYWERKNVRLLSVASGTPERTLWLFLDRLAAQVQGTQRLTLSPDSAEPTRAAQPLLQALLQVGEQLRDLDVESLTPDEVRVAAAALATLAEEGWRSPTYLPLPKLWQRLAARATPADRPRLLQQALRYTESKELAEVILTELKGSPS